MSPWTTEVEVLDGANVRMSLDVDLDEAHAVELLGKLSLALRQLRDGAGALVVIPVGGR